MSTIADNVSYILIPFRYNGKKSIGKYITELNDNNIDFVPISFDNPLFLGFIEALYQKVSGYKIHVKEIACDEMQFYCFETNIGFLAMKYVFSNKEHSSIMQQSDVIRNISDEIGNGTNDLLNKIDDFMPLVQFFPASGGRNCLTYNVSISKINNVESNLLTSGSERIFKIDKLHECYCSSKNMSIITNQHYDNLMIKEEDKVKEQQFRDKYEVYFLMMFMLLHHERQAYLIYREQIVTEKSKESRIVKELKGKILDLLSCYSFKLVTEDVEFQNVYAEYREVLDLAENEGTLSDLVFRLDDEIDKGREKKITFITFVITIFGMTQFISVIIDIIDFVNSFLK